MQVSMPTSVVVNSQGKLSNSKIDSSQLGEIFESIMFLAEESMGEGTTDFSMNQEAEGLQDLPLLEEDEELVTLNVMNTMPLVENEDLIKLNLLSSYVREDEVAIPPKDQLIKSDLFLDSNLLEGVKELIEVQKPNSSVYEMMELRPKDSEVEVLESVVKSAPQQSLDTARSFIHSVWLKEKPVTVVANQIPSQSAMVQTEIVMQEVDLKSATTAVKWENQVEIESTILHHARLLENNDSTKLVLKMVPRELGSLQIELLMKDGILTGSITAEQGETAKLLQQATLNLDQMFGKLEIKVDHLMNGGNPNLQSSQFDQSSKQKDQQLDRQLSKAKVKSGDREVQEVVSLHEKKQESHQLNVMA